MILLRGVHHALQGVDAAEPYDKPVGIEDLAMTIYNRLGINGEKRLVAPGGRPIDIVRGGKVLHEIVV